MSEVTSKMRDELDIFLKERIEYDPEMYVEIDEFGIEFLRFLAIKGLIETYDFDKVDRILQQKGIKKGCKRVSSFDRHGEFVHFVDVYLGLHMN